MKPDRYDGIIFNFNLTPAYLAVTELPHGSCPPYLPWQYRNARSYDTAKPNSQDLASTANGVACLLRILLTIELAATFVTRTFPSTQMRNIEPRTLQVIASHRGDSCPFHLFDFQQPPDIGLTSARLIGWRINGVA